MFVDSIYSKYGWPIVVVSLLKTILFCLKICVLFLHPEQIPKSQAEKGYVC